MESCVSYVKLFLLQGDSGGPLVCKGTLAGIVSFGAECGLSPGIYTSISSYTTGKKVPFVKSVCSSVTENDQVFTTSLCIIAMCINVIFTHNLFLCV